MERSEQFTMYIISPCTTDNHRIRRISTLMHWGRVSLQSTTARDSLAPFQLEPVAGTVKFALGTFCATGETAIALYAPPLTGWTVWICGVRRCMLRWGQLRVPFVGSCTDRSDMSPSDGVTKNPVRKRPDLCDMENEVWSMGYGVLYDFRTVFSFFASAEV